MRTEDYRREFLRICFAQRRLLLGTTLVVVAMGLLIALFWPRTYAAYGSVLVRSTEAQRDPFSLEATDIRSYPVEKEDLFSEVELIRSPAVIQQGEEPPHREISRIRASLDSEVVPVSNVIRLSLKGRQPETTRELLDEILTQYVVYRSDVHVPRSSELFFADRAERFREEMGDQEARLIAVLERSGSADPGREIEINLGIKQDLAAQRNRLQTELVEKRRLVAHLERTISSGSDQYFSFIDSPTIAALAQQLAELTLERGRVGRVYTGESTKISRLDEQVEETVAQLRSEARAYGSAVANEAAAIEDQIVSLDERIGEIDRRNLELRKSHLEMERIERDSALSAYSYETFAKRRDESKAGRADAAVPYSGFVSILEHAYPSDGPVFPRAKVVLPMSLLVGLLAGFCLGFLREYFDHTFKTPMDVERYAELPVLFSVEERQELA